MSRRLGLVLTAVLAAVLAAATLAIASGGSSSGTAAAPAPTSAAAPAATKQPARHGMRMGGRHGGAMFRMVQRVVLTSFAQRLDVEPKALKTAIHDIAEEQFAKKSKQAGLTQAQTDALVACHTARAARRSAAPSKAQRRSKTRAACDRTAVRAAMKKFKALPEPDLAALKTELSDALAAKLGGGVTGAKVLEAARAELDERLGQAVALGFVTAKGQTLALGCFDTPATCDVKALRTTVRGHGAKHARFGHR